MLDWGYRLDVKIFVISLISVFVMAIETKMLDKWPSVKPLKNENMLSDDPFPFPNHFVFG